MSEWVDVSGPVAKRPRQDPALTAPGLAHPRLALAATEQSAADPPASALPVTSGWAVATAVGLYCLLAGLLFRETPVSMVAIWLRSETFAHGFLILPISLWLTWRLRGRFSNLTVRAEPRALLLVLGAGLAWLLANLVDVQVIQQLAFIAILISGIWAIAGTQVVRCYAFPLGFLFLAVPMGAGLIPPLMEFTADTTEFLLRASGIPVFREGMYLSLPTGTWSVIEECSGVRYLIASFTLGLVFAHLTYHSLWRQAAFMLVAIAAPILANSLRAYALVMVGHLSEMRLGIGADHLLFGWVFFGLVMLLMFWIGSFWHQQESPPAPGSRAATAPRRSPALSLTLVTGLAMLSASVWPAVAIAMNRNSDSLDLDALRLPATLNSWQRVEGEDWHWYPAQGGADRQLDQVFVTGTAPETSLVGLHVRQYLQQQQGVELVDNTNPWRPDRLVWRVIEQQQTRIDLDRPVLVDEARVVSARQNLLVWSWYRIDDRNTANPYLVKLLEAKQQIIEGARQGTRVFVATPLGEDRKQARQVLQEFVTAYRAAIQASLDSEVPGQGIAPDLTLPEGVAR